MCGAELEFQAAVFVLKFPAILLLQVPVILSIKGNARKLQLQHKKPRKPGLLFNNF